MISIECSARSESAIGRELSNLTPRRFVFLGYEFASIEGFLQSIKCANENDAQILRGKTGYRAWKDGQAFGPEWKARGSLVLGSQEYVRTSQEYQDLLDAMYLEAFEQSITFQNALRLSSHASLYHNGVYDTSETVLTPGEYISNLYKLRCRLH